MGMERRTGHAREQLAGKVLYLSAWKRHEAISLQEVEDALPEKICDYTDVVSEVEGVAEMYTFVPVGLIVQGEGGEDSEFDAGGVPILLDRTYYLDGTFRPFPLIPSLDNFAKSSLPEQSKYVICLKISTCH